jgi:hypothetical protein
MNRHATSALAVLALSMTAAAPASADVPTAADFAGCNMKAAEQAASDTASASPRSDLPRDATRLPPDVKARTGPRGDVQTAPPAAGKAGTSGVTQDPTGNTLSSEKDPQIEGMAADRASDPAYVAAYRSCMRQRGF